MLKQLKLFFLCALSCFLLAVFFELNYYDSVYLLRIRKYVPSSPVCQCQKQDCLTDIIQMLRIASLNDTEDDRDLNLRALDMLISTVQTYVTSKNIYKRRDVTLKEELNKLDELRNEIRNRQIRGMISQSQTHEENGYHTEEPQSKMQERNEVDYEQITRNETESMEHYEQYDYQENLEQEIDEPEEGSEINIKEILTIVLNLNNYTYKDLSNIDKLVQSIPVLYPGVKTLVYSPFKVDQGLTKENVTFVVLNKPAHPGRVWDTLLELVNTTHVLLLRDVVSLDENSRVRNLLYNMKNLNVDFIGGATKNIHNGHWDMGCSQMAYRNYILVYKSGYRHSKNSCVYCHDVNGPFVAKTSILKQYNFTNIYLPEELMFHDLFFNQYKKSNLAICPDSMFHTRTSSVTTDRSQWLRFAVKNNVHRIVLPYGKTYTYTCEELGVEKNSIDDGKSVPYCTIQELINHIKFIMRTCRENLIICELSWGIELGAVKLNSIAPWEHDGDVSFYTPQAEKLMALEPLFQEHGYSLYYHRYTGEWDSPWLRSNSKWWHVDLFNRTKLDSADLILQGRSPTKVLFDGEWVETSNNVGYSVKRGYGPEIYKHKDYSMTYSQSYLGLNYVKCPDDGVHDCIDQLPSDGNFDIGDPHP